MAVWVVASVAFALYVANFGSYNKTYGSLASETAEHRHGELGNPP